MIPRLSIIIPVYNVEKYLPQCIDSVLAQSYRNFELILVDDGSPDGSPSICDRYACKDNRVKVIHQQNSGVSTARNNGIDNAKGEWITFIDSDDWVNPDYLANFGLDDADSLDLVIQGMEYYDQRTNSYYKKRSFPSCVISEHTFLSYFAKNRLLELGFPYGKAYHKDLLEQNKLRFDQRLSFHEDHIFVLDYYQLCSTIRLVDAIDYKYRCYHTAQSLSSKRHSWKNLSLCADKMILSLNRLHDKFLITGSEAEGRAYHFAYSPKLSAVNELFRSDDTYKNIKHNYYTIINNIELRKMYHPTDRRSRLFKSVMLHLPFCGIYLFFKALVKYQNRNR